VDVQHRASQRVLEKIGFIFKEMRRDGDLEDKVYLAVRPKDDK